MAAGDYIEISGGTITENYEEDYVINAGGNIILSAGKSVILHGEKGIAFGDYKEPPAANNEKSADQGTAIEQAEWLNEKKEKTKGLAYKEKVYVSITLKKSIKGKTLVIYFKESSNDILLKTVNYAIGSDDLVQHCGVDFTIDDFVKCEKHLGQYAFIILLDGEHYGNSSEILKVFPVIYVPVVMKHLGWSYAFKSQEDWFSKEPIAYPWESQPKLDDFYLGWV